MTFDGLGWRGESVFWKSVALGRSTLLQRMVSHVNTCPAQTGVYGILKKKKKLEKLGGWGWGWEELEGERVNMIKIHCTEFSEFIKILYILQNYCKMGKII